MTDRFPMTDIPYDEREETIERNNMDYINNLGNVWIY